MSGWKMSNEQRMLLNIGDDEYGDHLAGIAESIVTDALAEQEQRLSAALKLAQPDHLTPMGARIIRNALRGESA